MPRKIFEVAGAVGLGIALFVTVLALTSGGDEPTSTFPDQVDESTSIEALVGPVDHQEFLSAYQESLTATYLLVGSRTRFTNGEEEASLVIKQARLDGRAFLREGNQVVLVEDGVQQVCQISGSSLFDCGPSGPAPNDDNLVAVFAALLEPSSDNDRDPKYQLYEVSPLCWRAIATRPLPLEPWGQATTWCFDDETGALVHRSTATGHNSFVFEADSVTNQLVSGDLTIEGAE